MNDSERSLKSIEVEVRFKSGGPPIGHRLWVRVKLTETFKKIKKHVSESLDINGKLTYGEASLDDNPAKRLSEVYKGNEKFCLQTEKRPRDMKQHTVQLTLPASEGEGERTEEIKVARTTTIGNLKHKIQDEFGIAVDEHAIHMPSQQKECHPEHNVMGLASVLQVKMIQSTAQPKPTIRKSQSFKTTSIARGTPYDVKQTAGMNRRKSFDSSSIHPKIAIRAKEKDKTEEKQSDVSVSIQHAPYEMIHQLGKNFEQLKTDRSKKLVIEVQHKQEEENKMSIKSKLHPVAQNASSIE